MHIGIMFAWKTSAKLSYLINVSQAFQLEVNLDSVYWANNMIIFFKLCIGTTCYTKMYTFQIISHFSKRKITDLISVGRLASRKSLLYLDIRAYSNKYNSFFLSFKLICWHQGTSVFIAHLIPVLKNTCLWCFGSPLHNFNNLEEEV